ncbi:hypothetical protein DPEC_G00370670 [Dallia pectoralis]|nr:hypothetical protein DPEC_G00370670 [Dallia pectoralis]
MLALLAAQPPRIQLLLMPLHQLVPARLQPSLWFGPQHHEDGIITRRQTPTGFQMLRCMLAIKPGYDQVLCS